MTTERSSETPSTALRQSSGQGSEQASERPQKQLSQSYWALVWWRFKRSRTAIVGVTIVFLSYFIGALFAEFFSPYLVNQQSDYVEARPQWPHFVDQDGNFHLRPFVYGLEKKIDLELFKRTYVVDTSRQYPIYFFVRGEPYRLLGLIPTSIHLFGTDPNDPEAHVYLFGTDRLGRDVFSRIILSLIHISEPTRPY